MHRVKLARLVRESSRIGDIQPTALMQAQLFGLWVHAGSAQDRNIAHSSDKSTAFLSEQYTRPLHRGTTRAWWTSPYRRPRKPVL